MLPGRSEESEEEQLERCHESMSSHCYRTAVPCLGSYVICACRCWPCSADPSELGREEKVVATSDAGGSNGQCPCGGCSRLYPRGLQRLRQFQCVWNIDEGEAVGSWWCLVMYIDGELIGISQRQSPCRAFADFACLPATSSTSLPTSFLQHLRCFVGSNAMSRRASQHGRSSICHLPMPLL